MELTTYYETLEVSEMASMETIRAAYRSLSKRFHPDNLQTGSKEKFQKIEEAHKTLTCELSRSKYDAFLAEQRRPIEAKTQVQAQPVMAYDPTEHISTLFSLGTELLFDRVNIPPMASMIFNRLQPDIEKLAVDAVKRTCGL